jgi:hypothetical protein
MINIFQQKQFSPTFETVNLHGVWKNTTLTAEYIYKYTREIVFIIQPQCTLQLECEACVFFCLSSSSHFFTPAAASKIPASNSSHVSTFHLQTSLFIQFHKRNSNAVMSGDPNSSNPLPTQNLTPVHTNFCSHKYRQILTPPKILTFSFESPCIHEPRV